MPETLRLFVFGMGYSASEVARVLGDRADWIGGTAREEEKRERLHAAAWQAFAFDGTAPGKGVADAIAAATHLLISIPPGEAGDPVLACHRADILAASGLRWIGYLSTVGVYGNYGGAWVSERTTPHPRDGRSTWRLKAEKDWQSLAEAAGLPLAIFRIAGIYGPGRNAFVNLAAGKARRIVKPGQVFNRVHVADIAAAVSAALKRYASGIFNLADDEPAPPEAVVEYAAELMGVPPPPEITLEAAQLSPMARSFYEDNKRVLNRRVKDELGLALRYPTYREGLSSLWQEANWR